MTASPATPIYRRLPFQVLVAILCGVALGYFRPDIAVDMKILGDVFIAFIKMMIAPIIFCTIVTGIAGMENMKHVGRVGVKALIYFEIITTFALIIGLVVAHVFQPGADLNIDITSIDTSAVQQQVHKPLASFSDFLTHLTPHSFVGAFVEGEILQVLVIAILFAWAVIALGERGRPVIDVISSFSTVLFEMIALITKAAPLGAFGAMAYTIGKFGIGSLVELGEFILLFYATCVLFVVLVLGAVLRVCCNASIFRFVSYIWEELMIVFGTSSSETALPRMIEKMQRLGCKKSVVGMVITTGYSFNLDGTSIYLTLGALFVAHATGLEMTLWQELTLLGILLLTSKGAAGVTGSGFVVLAATLSSMKIIPDEHLVIGLALVFAVDRFMSEARALTNLVGNGVATVVVAKWEKALDEEKMQSQLS